MLTSSELAPELPLAEHRILRLREVESRTGFRHAHLYPLMQKGEFPQAVRLGMLAVGWDSVEVDEWVAERLTHRVARVEPPCK